MHDEIVEFELQTFCCTCIFAIVVADALQNIFEYVLVEYYDYTISSKFVSNIKVLRLYNMNAATC